VRLQACGSIGGAGRNLADYIIPKPLYLIYVGAGVVALPEVLASSCSRHTEPRKPSPPVRNTDPGKASLTDKDIP
jgi:hypothetical protein